MPTGTPGKFAGGVKGGSRYDTATQTFKKPSPAPKPNAKAPLGQGGRFAALKGKLANEPGVDDPAALAASIGRKKFGAKKFNSLSHKG